MPDSIAAHVVQALRLPPDPAPLLVHLIQRPLHRLQELVTSLLTAALELAPDGVRFVVSVFVANLPLLVQREHVSHGRVMEGTVGVRVVACESEK